MLENDYKVLKVKFSNKLYEGSKLTKMQAAYNDGVQAAIKTLERVYLEDGYSYLDFQELLKADMYPDMPGRISGNRNDARNAGVLACKSIVKDHFMISR